MPLYRDIRDLPAWESAFHRARGKEEDRSEVGRLLGDVFDFGCENMYGAFEISYTRQCFEVLARELSRSGVSMPDPGDLTDWSLKSFPSRGAS
jgi:hypothetical protein